MIVFIYIYSVPGVRHPLLPAAYSVIIMGCWFQLERDIFHRDDLLLFHKLLNPTAAIILTFSFSPPPFVQFSLCFSSISHFSPFPLPPASLRLQFFSFCSSPLHPASLLLFVLLLLFLSSSCLSFFLPSASLLLLIPLLFSRCASSSFFFFSSPPPPPFSLLLPFSCPPPPPPMKPVCNMDHIDTHDMEM